MPVRGTLSHDPISDWGIGSSTPRRLFKDHNVASGALASFDYRRLRSVLVACIEAIATEIHASISNFFVILTSVIHEESTLESILTRARARWLPQRVRGARDLSAGIGDLRTARLLPACYL
ncbi:hypothetical protein EVAR_75395_1 [Eumeta japonica]|uniref:Uncharacterized protein n=1 Tax=Eumeta variegata TaxID=151549 RepID=A0A4C1TMG0_EUMVA|nr:hypothetical protein EVAR_75395_1 [Eumeta japonica]